RAREPGPPPRHLRGRGQSHDRTRELPKAQRHPPRLPRSAHGIARDRHQHDPNKHAHGGVAETIPIPHRGTPEPTTGTDRKERTSRRTGAIPPGLRGASQKTTGRTPEHERGTEGKSVLAGGTK